MRDENGNLVADPTETLNLWKNYFDELLNLRQARVEGKFGKIHTADLLIVEPTDKEIETAIKKLKSYKVVGIEELLSELIRMPEEWNTSLITPIKKKAIEQTVTIIGTGTLAFVL